MKQFVAKNENENQRFDKFLFALLPGANNSFIYKMLRKKNITLNGKKAIGSERLSVNDEIKIFFSDETFEKLSKSDGKETEYEDLKKLHINKLSIVYENEDILVLNKPFGILSQKSEANDISINEYALSYMISKGLSFEEYKLFKPSIVNRLDRNTGGLILFAKNRNAAVSLSKDIKEKNIKRVYNCISCGQLDIHKEVVAYYKKDEKNNIAHLKNNNEDGYTKVVTRLDTISIDSDKDISLLEAVLLTGKSHQIRATMKYLSHPILNDKKYGGNNQKISGSSSLPGQYLFAKRVVFPDGLVVEAELPKEFNDLLS